MPTSEGSKESRALNLEGEEDGAPGGGGQPAQPQFVPAEEFKRFQETITGTLNAVNETLGFIKAAASRQSPQVKVEEPPPVVSREAYVRAVQESDLLTVEAYERRKEWEANQRLSGVASILHESVSSLTADSTVKGMKHYTRFKSEIDGYIGSLPAVSKLNPHAHMLAYEAVVGRHADELEKEARETALRETASGRPGDGGQPGSTTGRTAGRKAGEEQVPTVEEFVGKEAAAELTSKGETGDSFARKLGYKDWAAYMKVAQGAS